jgi:hypothetical protein
MRETGQPRAWWWHAIQWLALGSVLIGGPFVANGLYDLFANEIGNHWFIDLFIAWAVGYIRLLAIVGGTIILFGTILGIRDFTEGR